MVALQDELGKDGKFTVLAFPCNQFGYQEPKGDGAIFAFGKSRGATFPFFHKADVNGQNTQPVYEWLKKETKTEDTAITWNFGTYWVVDATGAARRYDIASPLKAVLPSFLKSEPISSPDDLKPELVNLVKAAQTIGVTAGEAAATAEGSKQDG